MMYFANSLLTSGTIFLVFLGDRYWQLNLATFQHFFLGMLYILILTCNIQKHLWNIKLIVYFPYFLDSGSVLRWVGYDYYSLILIISSPRFREIKNSAPCPPFWVRLSRERKINNWLHSDHIGQIYQYSSYDFFYRSYTAEELHNVLGWRQQQGSGLGVHTSSQSYNKIQIHDLGEWWDLCGTISIRRLDRWPGIHAIGWIRELVPYSIDNRYRVQTPSSVLMEGSRWDLPTPFSLRVLPPLFWTKASQKIVSLEVRN